MRHKGCKKKKKKKKINDLKEQFKGVIIIYGKFF